MHNSEILQNTFNYWGADTPNSENKPSQCRKHVQNVLIMSKSILNLNLITDCTHHIYSQLQAKLGAVIVNCPTKKAFSGVQSSVHLCHKINIFWHFKVRNISFLCKCETVSFLHLPVYRLPATDTYWNLVFISWRDREHINVILTNIRDWDWYRTIVIKFPPKNHLKKYLKYLQSSWFPYCPSLIPVSKTITQEKISCLPTLENTGNNWCKWMSEVKVLTKQEIALVELGAAFHELKLNNFKSWEMHN